MRLLFWLAIWIFLSGAAFGQGMVEAAILTSGSGTAAAKAGKTINSAVTNTLGNVSKVLGDAKSANTSPKAAASAKPVTRIVTLPSTKAPEIQPGRPEKAELDAMKEGTPKAELLAKAGHPSFAITSPENGHLVEVLSYTTKEGAPARVRLSDGKLASVEWPEPK